MSTRLAPTELVLLGSTGSIGTQALEVVDALADAGEAPVRVRALGAGGGRLDLLARQAARYRPDVVAVASDAPGTADALRDALRDAGAEDGDLPEIRTGEGSMAEIAGMLDADGTADGTAGDAGTGAGGAGGHAAPGTVPDPGPGDGVRRVVLNGVTGSVGLAPTLAALDSGATLALANKESLVVGGALVQRAQRRPGQVVPVDSEHSAMAQALASGRHEAGMCSPVVTGTTEVRRLILTASGGPFRGRTRAQLADVTPDQALAHPTWAMGPVVTTNSSTLMNKGLELIEASLLFGIDPDDITVVVHPQSVVHSMVEFVDGSTIAQASPPDMRLPIALGLTWPVRPPLGERLITPCAWDAATAWTFEPLDEDVFRAVRLARESAAASALHPAVLNAANEQCVAAFLAGHLPYLRIVEVVEEVLASFDPGAVAGAPDGGYALADHLEAERWARAAADARIAASGNPASGTPASGTPAEGR